MKKKSVRRYGTKGPALSLPMFATATWSRTYTTSASMKLWTPRRTVAGERAIGMKIASMSAAVSQRNTTCFVTERSKGPTLRAGR
jgi:hypothetical protein